jgi:hypothetical protein
MIHRKFTSDAFGGVKLQKLERLAAGRDLDVKEQHNSQRKISKS